MQYHYVVDLTYYWNPGVKAWCSANASAVNHFTAAGYQNTSALVVAQRQEAYLSGEGTTDKFQYALSRALWRLKFDIRTKHIVLIVPTTYFSDLVKKFVPSAFAVGINVTVVFGSKARTYAAPISREQYAKLLREKRKVDMLEAYQKFGDVLDFIQEELTDVQNLALLQEEADRLVFMAKEMGIDFSARGPITASRKVKNWLPQFNDIWNTVETLAPLYEIDIPNTYVTLPSYSNTRLVNTDVLNGKHLRPNTVVRSPHWESARLEDDTQVYIVYLQLTWFLMKRIKPTYLWANVPEEDAPVRLLPSECRALGVHGFIRQR